MIGVDEVKLRVEGLTPNEAFYLLSLNTTEDVVIGKMSNQKFLRDNGYLTDSNRLTEKGVEYLNETFRKVTVRKTLTEKDVAELSEKYRELFPKDIKTGLSPVRGNLKNIIGKMIAFKNKYPKYTDELILKTVEKYVSDKKKEGYAFMTTSENMLSKNGVSLLATLCDAYNEVKDGTERKWGRNI